jgi:hypothetical protein
MATRPFEIEIEPTAGCGVAAARFALPAVADSLGALLSKKIDWRPAGKREQPLGHHDKHHESEHQKEQRNILLDLGAMKATFSRHGANTSLLVL